MNGETPAEGRQGGCDVSMDEVLDNFEALLDDADFLQELRMLGVGRFQIFRRRHMLRELRALYIALWRLALSRSFPQEHGRIFDAFLARALVRRAHKESADLLARAVEYGDLLLARGDRDFTEVSQRLAALREKDPEALKALALRLALSIRATYNLIFERLI